MLVRRYGRVTILLKETLLASICVFCSSRNDLEAVFIDAAREMGRLITEAGHTLVYGGGSVGLMGETARAAHAAGGHVVGVIPRTLDEIEVGYKAADELVVVETMRERKQILEDRADAFIAMPGGFGTLEELSEIIVGRYLKFHNKPIVILNVDGFYDPLLAFFDELMERKFASGAYRDHYRVADTVAEALAFLAVGQSEK